jgi:hypothetical protein
MMEHILKGRISDGRKFIQNAHTLALQLSAMIGMPLQLDINELSKVEQYVMACYEQRGNLALDDLMRPASFEPILAFFGETLAVATGGEWRVCYCEKYDVWEPWIVWELDGHTAGYELASVCGQFVNFDPETFSLTAEAIYTIKRPIIFE